MRPFFRTMLLAALAPVAAGCINHELCYDHSHRAKVNVVFDWSAAPDAAPESMVVWAFPEDGSDGIRHEIVTARQRSEAVIELPPGSYRMVCFNNHEDNRESGSRFGEFMVTTGEQNLLAPLGRSDQPPRPQQSAAEPVRGAAGTVWSHVHETILEIAKEDLAEGVSHTVTFVPRRVTAVVNVLIDGITNMFEGLQASGIITGVSDAWMPAAGGVSPAAVTVPFALECDPAGSRMRGTLMIFGDAAPHDVAHKLRVYTSLNLYYDYDVTTQIHQASDPLNIDIRVSGMLLPGDGESISPGVKDWKDSETINIRM